MCCAVQRWAGLARGARVWDRIAAAHGPGADSPFDLMFGWRRIRGNVSPRLQKLKGPSALEGVVLAAAGLVRLGLEAEIGGWPPTAAVPAVAGSGSDGHPSPSRRWRATRDAGRRARPGHGRSGGGRAHATGRASWRMQRPDRCVRRGRARRRGAFGWAGDGARRELVRTPGSRWPGGRDRRCRPSARTRPAGQGRGWHPWRYPRTGRPRRRPRPIGESMRGRRAGAMGHRQDAGRCLRRESRDLRSGVRAGGRADRLASWRT